MYSRVLSVILAVALSACAGMYKSSGMKATVTGISAGRAGVPSEQVYVVRSPGGRVYTTQQVIDKPPVIGDVVLIEVTGQGGARIIGPAYP